MSANVERLYQRSAPMQMTSFGAGSTILLGVSYILVGIFLIIDPSIGLGAGSAEFYQTVADHPFLTSFRHLMYAVGGILGLAVVPALSNLFATKDKDWMRFLNTLALLAFGVTALDSYRLIFLIPERAETFLASDSMTQVVITATENLARVDMPTWIRFGGMVPWLLAIGIIALRENKLPKPFAYLAIAQAVVLFGTVIGITFLIWPLISATIILGTLIMPTWFIWAGIILQRTES